MTLVEFLRTCPGSRVNPHVARFVVRGKQTEIRSKRVARHQVRIEESRRRGWHDMEEFDTLGAGVHAIGPDRFFAKIVDGYLAKTENRGGRMGDAKSHLFRARKLPDFALALIEGVATDALRADGRSEPRSTVH